MPGRIATGVVIVWLAVSAAVGGQGAERAFARDVLRELIEIPTTADHNATPRAAQAMADRLVAAGFQRDDVRVLNLNPRVGNLVARFRGSEPNRPPILLMAHIDVVPALREDWSVDPWVLLERDGWFYGRGTTDNKAGAAMLVANFVRLKREGWQPRGDLIIALTGDEETSQTSIQYLLKEHRGLVNAGFALNTDSGRIILKNGRPSLFTVQASEKIYADYQLEVTDVGAGTARLRVRTIRFTRWRRRCSTLRNISFRSTSPRPRACSSSAQRSLKRVRLRRTCALLRRRRRMRLRPRACRCSPFTTPGSVPPALRRAWTPATRTTPSRRLPAPS
jgi:hypothetical protein